MKEKRELKSICFMIPDLGSGGAQRVMCNLANYFAKKKYEVSIFCFHSDEIACFYELEPSIALYNLPAGYKRKRRNVLKCAHMARKIFKQIKPDLVIPFLMPVNIYAFFATRFTDMKLVVSERNDPRSAIKFWEWKYLRDYAFHHADGCVFQTEDALEYFGKRVSEKSKVILNPTTLCFDGEKRVPASKREKKVVCIGRYDPQKNHPLLIRAFAGFLKEFPEYELEIYGRDFHGYQKVMEELIAKLGMEKKIHLMGPHKNIYPMIESAAMSVLASDYEGMPNALIETMALGIPSIATDCPIGGPRSMIQDGVNGFLIPCGDEDLLKKRMMQIAADEELADRMAKEAMKTTRKYDIRKIGAQWETLIAATTGLALKET